MLFKMVNRQRLINGTTRTDSPLALTILSTLIGIAIGIIAMPLICAAAQVHAEPFAFQVADGMSVQESINYFQQQIAILE